MFMSILTRPGLHHTIIANHLGAGGARQSSGLRGWIVHDERYVSKYYVGIIIWYKILR